MEQIRKEGEKRKWRLIEDNCLKFCGKGEESRERAAGELGRGEVGEGSLKMGKRIAWSWLMALIQYEGKGDNAELRRKQVVRDLKVKGTRRGRKEHPSSSVRRERK